MTLTFTPDWNSFISAVIGGLLALLGTWLTLRGTIREREKEDCRELISLFYFLNSKVALITNLGNHPEGVPIMSIVSEDEILNVRKLYNVASRAISIEDIGEIDNFCNMLRTLEGIRLDFAEKRGKRTNNVELYHEALSRTLKCISPGADNKGINEIGKRIEYYFSNELKTEYTGYKYK